MRTTHTNQKWMIRLSWLRSNCTALSVSTLYDYEVTVGVRSHTQKHTRKCAHAYHALRTTKASDFFSLLLYSYILFLVVCFGLSSGINTKNWVCHKMWLAICSAPSTTHNPYHTKHAFCVIFFPPRLRSNRDGYKFNYIFVHAKRNGWLNGEKKIGNRIFVCGWHSHAARSTACGDAWLAAAVVACGRRQDIWQIFHYCHFDCMH